MDFHPHADFDAPLGYPDAQPLNELGHPVGAHPARCQDDPPALVGLPGGAHPGHGAVFHQNIFHRLAGVDIDALGDMLGQGRDVLGQTVAAQVFLFDDEQVDAVLFGFLAQAPGLRHVRGKGRAVHAEAVEDQLGLVDQGLGGGAGQELGQIGFAQLVDVVELAVGKQSGSTDAV